MAKTPSDKLYRLVQSLTPAEKRYFRIYIRGKTERHSKYLALFDAMSDMAQYNENTLRGMVYEEEKPGSKKYSELKAYLYELILKCLQNFDEGQSVEYRLNQLLQSVAVLFKRGHYDDCEDQLHKAAKTAKQYESFAHLVEVLRWQKQLAYTRMDVDFLHKRLEQLQYEEDRALEQMRNVAAYRKAFFQMYTFIKREAQQRDLDRKTQLKNLIKQPLFESPDKASSHKSRIFYFRTLNLYHYAALEYADFYETGIKLVQLLESQTHFLRENLSDYIAALSNLVLSCGMLARYDEVRLWLEKLRNLEPITEDDRMKIHRQYYSNFFALCTYTGEFEAAYREIDNCRREAAAFRRHEYETGSFYGQYCTICFGCGDYDAALDYLNQWLSQPRTVEREDAQSLARVISLILHFEKGNMVLLESLLRSATRFMRKKNRLFDLERRFMQFMGELLRKPGRKAQLAAFQSMKADLQGEPLKTGVQALLQAFDLDAWLNSKINNIHFAESVKQKYEAAKR